MKLAIPSLRAGQIARSLLAARPLESGCFCTVAEVSRGDVRRLVLGPPLETETVWAAQGERQLTPTGKQISQAISEAQSATRGLAFIHTHPMTRGEPALSAIDEDTTLRLGEVCADLLDGPFLSLVVSGDHQWAGVHAHHGELAALQIQLAGRHIRTWNPVGLAAEARDILDDRQRPALGAMGHVLLRSLTVAVIGAGGLGSPVAETLVRMGVAKVKLIDFDVLDTPSNLRRVFGARASDLDAPAAPRKVDVVARHLRGLGLGVEIEAIGGDIREPSIQAHLLDCDVIVNGTDTHGSRAALTEISVRSSLPLIDIGVRVGVRGGSVLDALLFERRVVIPEGPCLWCWGRLDPERIRIEAMPAEQRAQLLHEGYITGLDEGPAPSVAALTVTAAGAACDALLGIVAGGFDIAPLAMSVDALSLESIPLGRETPDPECVCRRWRV